MVIIRKEYKIGRCSDCPNYASSMDGPFCNEIEQHEGPYSGMIWKISSEAREGVSEKCPFYNTLH